MSSNHSVILSLSKDLSFRSLLIILVLVLIPIVVLLRLRQTAVSVSAAWFNDSWAYRQRLDITNPSGTNLTDFQVNINVGTSALIAAGKLQSTCADIRVTNNQGQVLPHWIEENNPGCNQLTDTKIWVKVPSLPSAGATLYLYYGNASATDVQNGTSVFDFFDDFNDNQINADKWTYTNTSPITTTENSGVLNRGGTGPASYPVNTFSTKSTFNNYRILEAKVRINTCTAAEALLDLRTSVGDFTLRKSYTTPVKWENYTGSWNDIAASAISVGGTFVNIKLIDEASGSSIYENNTFLGKKSTAISSGASVIKLPTRFYMNAGETCSIDLDNVRVRQYVTTDPTTSFSTEENSPAPVAYWKFDEGIGTTAYDSTTNKFNAVLIGSTIPIWANESECISGKCLKFVGDNTAGGALRSQSTGYLVNSTEFTISAWINVKQLHSDYQVISSDGWTKYYFGMAPNSKNLRMIIRQPDSSQITSGDYSLPELNHWYHVVGVVSQINNYVKLYVDGRLVKNNSTNFTVQTNSSYVYVGSVNGNSTGDFFNGLIDDFKIYKYARTPAQIVADYNAGKAHAATAKGVAANLGSNIKNTDALSNGLVGYWKLDENVGTSSADSSGNNYTATFATGTSTPAWGNGKYGVGISFNGTTSYLASTTIPYVGVPGKTGCAWIYPVSYPNSLNGVIRKNGTSGMSIRLTSSGYFNDRVVNSAGANSSAYQSASPAPLNAWSFVCATWESPGPNQNIKLRYYLNGRLDLDVVTDISDPNGYLETNANRSLWIGDDPDLSYRVFNGLIDEVRLYNRTLNPAEISQLYNYAPGPVAYWKFDEAIGTTAFDSSGNSNNAALAVGTSAPIWTNGKYGAALSFDGQKQYATVGTVLSNYNQFTAEAWVKPTDSDWVAMIGGPSSSTNQYNFSFGRHSNGNYYLSYSWDNSGTLTTVYSYGPTSVLNQWQHIVVTVNQTNNFVKFYLNGQLTSGTVDFVSKPMTSIAQNIQIGRLGSTGYFGGSLDDVKIYNYARTQKQVVEDMNAGHPAGGSPVGSQVGYWKFDEGYGIVTQNWGNAGIGASAALSGAVPPAWTNDGKFQKALNFNGSSSRAAINSSTLGDLTSAATVSMWVNPLATNISGLFDHYTGGNGNTGPFYLWWTSSKFRFSIANGTTSNNVFSPLTYATNTWYYVAGSFDGTTVKLYVNGSLVASGSQTITPLANSQSWNIGSMATMGFFNGLIDEVKVYNSALTDDEVKLDYNNGKAIVMGSLSSAGTGNTAPNTAASQEYCVPGDSTSCAPPILRWNFDENTGIAANDSTGNNNIGTLAGTTKPSWSIGKYGTALTFNGSTNYVSSGNGTNTQLTTGTVEAWIKTANPGSTFRGIVTKQLAYGMFLNANEFGIYDWSVGAWRGSGRNLNDNKWHQVAFSFQNGVTNGTTLYIDGVGITNVTMTVTNQTVAVVAGAGSAGASQIFNGSIDDVRLYNYARTPAQIAWDYNRGQPIAWYKFDECQGSTISDWSMNHNAGVLSIGLSGSQNVIGTCSVGSSAAWTAGASGKWGSSLNFDGTDDFVATTSPITISNSFSYAFWIKVPTSWDNSYPMAIGFRDSYGSPTYAAEVIPAHAGVSNKVHFQIYKAGWISVDSLAPLTQGWHHIVAVYNSATATELLYIDGTPNNSSPGPASFAGGTSTMYFGATIGGVHAGYMLKGQLDDVRIYNYSLTSEQIKQVYNNGSVVNYAPVIGSP